MLNLFLFFDNINIILIMNITILKRFFSIVPERATRYFSLTLNLNKTIPIEGIN
jgi:hypothetical protein